MAIEVPGGRRELGKHYVKSENEVISYCRYINNQVKFEWD